MFLIYWDGPPYVRHDLLYMTREGIVSTHTRLGTDDLRMSTADKVSTKLFCGLLTDKRIDWV